MPSPPRGTPTRPSPRSSTSACGAASGRSRAARSRWPSPGDVLEYRIGHASVLVTRDRDGALHAMRNACRHRGSPLVQGRAHVDDCLRCPYHGWSYELDGRLRAVVDPEDFGERLPEGLRLAPVAVGHVRRVRVREPRRRGGAARASSSARSRSCSRRTGSTGCGCDSPAPRCCPPTGRRSSTPSTRATTCRPCIRRSSRGPTTPRSRTSSSTSTPGTAACPAPVGSCGRARGSRSRRPRSTSSRSWKDSCTVSAARSSATNAPSSRSSGGTAHRRARRCWPRSRPGGAS